MEDSHTYTALHMDKTGKDHSVDGHGALRRLSYFGGLAKKGCI